MVEDTVTFVLDKNATDKNYFLSRYDMKSLPNPCEQQTSADKSPKEPLLKFSSSSSLLQY